jgi:hypothetical protein
MPEPSHYLGPEARARVEIDKQLTAVRRVVQRHRQMNLGAGRGGGTPSGVDGHATQPITGRRADWQR